MRPNAIRFRMFRPQMASLSSRGFALPTVLAVGLILVLVSLTVILRTLSDRQVSAVQGITLQGLMTTETGVTQVQNLLIKYPGLAAQPLTDWSVDNAEILPAPACGTTQKTPQPQITVSREDEQLIQKAQQQAWISVSNQGQYRVARYTIDSNDNSASLDIQGEYGFERPARTSVQVKMPLEFSTPSAGIWVTAEKSNSRPIEIDQNKTIDANVFIDDLSGQFNLKAYLNPGTISCQKFIDGTCKSHQISISKSRKPSTKAIPVDSWANKGQKIPTLLNGKTKLTLPNPSQDKADADQVYRYLVEDSLMINDSAQLIINPTNNQKVIIYLSKDLSVSGTAQINNNGQAENLEIYGSSLTQSYGKKAKSQTKIINVSNSSPINAFIYAPDADAFFTGKGALKGALWVRTLKTQNVDVNSGVPTIAESNCLKDLEVGNPNPGDSQTASIRPPQTWKRQPFQ